MERFPVACATPRAARGAGTGSGRGREPRPVPRCECRDRTSGRGWLLGGDAAWATATEPNPATGGSRLSAEAAQSREQHIESLDPGQEQFEKMTGNKREEGAGRRPPAFRRGKESRTQAGPSRTASRPAFALTPDPEHRPGRTRRARGDSAAQLARLEPSALALSRGLVGLRSRMERTAPEGHARTWLTCLTCD